MGKMKMKKGLSEKKLAVKKPTKSNNPFEVHVNRQKFNVLGRKLKGERGLPGLSRARSIKKRKETLLQEYKVRDKANKFIDRRIGERNKAMTREDKIMARFTAERMKAHNRKTMYNLADDEVLTHRGRSLAEIERFDDPRSDDDDNDPDDRGGGLGANFVEEAHFGGGMFKKAENTRLTVIEQLIADSKKRKAEKQQAKEKTLEKTEQLDAEWKELATVLSVGKPGEDVLIKKDSYDILMNELKFDARGKPSDRLKSEDEIASEEARKLQELEEERLRRMRGEENVTNVTQHRSADDLDDGFNLDDTPDFSLAYDKDGNPINLPENEDVKNEQKQTELEHEGSDNEEEDEEDDDSGEESDDLSDLKVQDKMADEDDDDDDEDNENEKIELEEESKTKSEDKLDSGGPSEEKKSLGELPSKEDTKDPPMEICNLDSKILKKESESSNQNVKKEKKKLRFDMTVKEVLIEKLDKSLFLKQDDPDFSKKKELIEAARKELPYTFSAPKVYEDLLEVFKGRTLEEHTVILERMIKCNHPSLKETNREELENLFAFLLQYLNDASYKECWTILDCMAPVLFDLVQFSTANAAHCVREVLLEKHSDYIQRKHKYPPIETLMFLKLIPLLFPTSDKRHPVTTPAMVFMCEVLDFCYVSSRRTVASGLFIVSLMVEYTNLSKRICPEVFNFLCGIFHLATPPSDLKVMPPFKQEHKFLYLQQPHSDMAPSQLKMQGSDLSPKSVKIDDDFRVRSVYSALHLMNTLVDFHKDKPACFLLFEPVKKFVENLEVDKYPGEVKTAKEKLLSSIESTSSEKLIPLAMELKKPKVLRLYEPSIQPVYEGRKKKDQSEEKAEHEKLVHKYKREMKGAIREIRRDRTFLAKVKIKEQLASDLERKRKVKQIYSWGAQQEGELKKIKRSKK